MKNQWKSYQKHGFPDPQEEKDFADTNTFGGAIVIPKEIKAKFAVLNAILQAKVFFLEFSY